MTVNPTQLRLLATLLAAPTEESLPGLEALTQTQAWLGEAVTELHTIPLEQWQGEHTRLFMSGYPQTPCPPFESAYRHGVMGGTAAEALLSLYHRVGLEPKDIAADYLGVILECAAYLLERPEPLDPALWTAVWDEHLRGWVPRLAEDLKRESHLALYRQLGAQLLSLFPDPTPESAGSFSGHSAP